MSHICTLPNELLLQISSHIHGRYRNSTLVNLALSARRFRPIAQEQLFCSPAFKLTHVHEFMWELGHCSWCIPKIQRLEIWSESRERAETEQMSLPLSSPFLLRNMHAYKAIKCPREVVQDKQFIWTCKKFIVFYSRTRQHSVNWLDALYNDVVPALLGVLFVALPNLIELKLAAAWIMDFPVFSGLLTREVGIVYPRMWRHTFLSGVLDQLRAKLEVLEIPTDLSNMTFLPRPRALFDFRSFARLRVLSVPMEALFFYDYIQHPPVDPRTVFPETLEILRICEATEMTANFVNELSIARNASHFSSLHRLELYFNAPLSYVIEMAEEDMCPHPVSDVKRMCVSMELALLLYFPGTFIERGDMERSLWSLREGGELDSAEERLCSENEIILDTIGGLLASFDADGDVDMGWRG